ncbi:MAG: hypothetical protein K1X74_09025 [Pirellulales bacterium]|nr:hypothetical protein [Pirellulales bacterium]
MKQLVAALLCSLLLSSLVVAQQPPRPPALRAVKPAAPAPAAAKPGAVAPNAPPDAPPENAPAAETPAAGAEATEPAEQDHRRIYEYDPFDQVVLKDPKGAVVKIQLLPSRKPIVGKGPQDKLIVRLYDDFETEYEILWKDIERVDLFEQMILAEAARLLGEKNFDAAFDYLRYLRKNYPTMPELEPLIQEFLLAEADEALAANDLERCFALLSELDARGQGNPKLPDAFGRVVDRLIGDRVKEGQPELARGILARFSVRFGGHPVAEKWRQTFEGRASKLAAEALASLSAGDTRQALSQALAAVEIWPQAPAAREAMEKVHAAYPLVAIGVLEPWRRDADPLVDGASRRVRRLIHRPLFELDGVGAEGGRYGCPWGEANRTDLGLGIALRLRSDVHWSDGSALTSFQLARHLLGLADRRDPLYNAELSQLLAGVDATDATHLQLRFRRAHVLPEALLDGMLTRRDGAQGVQTGPLVVKQRAAEELTLAMLPGVAQTGPHEIVERTFTKGASAIDALLRGEIAALAEINPWDVQLLAGRSDITVAAYAWPTVHCLVPNVARPLGGNRTFRRALAYVINRESILRQYLLRGREDPSSMVVSGPFVRGTSFDDARGYANNDQIAPRASDPQLALTLASVGILQAYPPAPAEETTAAAPAGDTSLPDAAAAQDAPAEPGAPGNKPSGPKPKLVLVYPPTEVARTACNAMVRYLQLLGVNVELRELEPQGELPDDWDFRYCELAAWEPVVDAVRLFGPGGVAAGVSPYMELALRELSLAEDWSTARRLLLEIHRRIHDDVAIVPLWQLTNHCAWHKRLQGIGEQPVTLYQHVESWQVAPWYPPDVEVF